MKRTSGRNQAVTNTVILFYDFLILFVSAVLYLNGKIEFIGVLPLLPAFPFLMLAAFCFARSSEKLDNWFKNTKLYKNNLESFVKGQGMTWKTKIRIMILVTILMSVGFIMMDQVPIGRIVLGLVWLFHIVYFTFGIKNYKKEIHLGKEILKGAE